MTRKRRDFFFGAAHIVNTGAVFRNSGDVVGVSHVPASGVYDITWVLPCFDAFGRALVSFDITQNGQLATFTCGVAPVAGQPRVLRVFTFLAGVAADVDFHVKGLRSYEP